MRIYLDHNATTPVDPAAADAMMRALQDLFGNASSVHYYGQQAKAAIDDARSAVAALIGAEPSEIIFTSGGTEADNFAIRGAAEALELTGRKHLITSGIEHEAVLNTFKALAKRGWRTTLLPLDASGIVSPDRLREAMTDDTALVSIMHANNEIGTIQPIAELARDCARARRALPHRRGAERGQDSGERPARSASICSRCRPTSSTARRASARCGSKRGVRLSPFLSGGKQERNRRAGTENVPGADRHGRRGRTRAMQKMDAEGGAPRRRCAIGSRTAFCRRCRTPTSTARASARVPNTTNISFDRIEAESLLIALDLEGVAVSTGSACSSGTLEPSHVLKAMSLSSHRAQNSIRFSLGASNTEEQIDRVIAILPRIVTKLRSLSAVGSRDRDLLNY